VGTAISQGDKVIKKLWDDGKESKRRPRVVEEKRWEEGVLKVMASKN